MISCLILLALYQDSFKKEVLQEKESITISWFEWAPTYAFRELTKKFTEETGIEVIVKIYPIPEWQSGVFGDLAEKKATSDLIIGDSQWLGMGSQNGHFIDITKWIKDHEVDKTMVSAAITGYSEFPKGSGRYLFEDPEEKRKFLEKYGYELRVPESWYEIRDIAEFFYRPQEDFYGLGIITSNAYDTITMGFENVFFSFSSLSNLINFFFINSSI